MNKTELKKFDVLIYRAKVLGVNLPFYHAALFTEPHQKLLQTPMVVESLSGGPIHHELDLERYPKYVCRLKQQLTPDQEEAIWEAIQSFLYRKYDWRSLIRAIISFGTWLCHMDSERIRCDELIVRVFQAGGIDIDLNPKRPIGFIKNEKFILHNWS